MLILSKEDIKKCFTMDDAISAAQQALVIYRNGEAEVPIRNNLRIEEANGNILYMPAATNGEISASGLKVASVYPDNVAKNLPAVPATMILVDINTGFVEAILDGTYLTQLRTGAVQGAATAHLAKQDASIGALIGTGGQAETQALAMLTVRNLSELRVYGLDFEKTKQFVKRLQENYSNTFVTKIIACNKVSDCVNNADIITTVTTSKTPTFSNTDVKNGAHINGVGAYTEDMIEIPKGLIGRANKIYFDTKEGVLEEAGDILLALKEKLITTKDVTGELGDLILGNTVGRENNDEITLFKTVGTAVLDVVTAKLIVEKAKKMGIGTKINL